MIDINNFDAIEISLAVVKLTLTASPPPSRSAAGARAR